MIEDEPYYHGFMSREETEKLIKKEGEFLGGLGVRLLTIHQMLD